MKSKGVVMDEQDLSKVQAKKFNFLVEQERFRNNVEAVSRMSEQLLILISQLKSLFEEAACIQADTLSLRRELNQAAIKLDLPPIPAKRKNF
jgi:hypothetical protein